MIKKLNKACKKVNDNLGVSIELPELRKSTLKVAGILNFVVGTEFVTAGIMRPSKWCLAVGGLGIVSSIVQRHEAKIAK